MSTHDESARPRGERDGLEVRCRACGSETVVVIRKAGTRFLNARVGHCPRCGAADIAVREGWEAEFTEETTDEEHDR